MQANRNAKRTEKTQDKNNTRQDKQERQAGPVSLTWLPDKSESIDL